jgi:hypothetical protein
MIVAPAFAPRGGWPKAACRTGLLAIAVGAGTLAPAWADSGAPAWQRAFHDYSTGLVFEVPAPLVIGKRRGHARHDLVIEIDSADLPKAGSSASLCAVALKEQSEDVRALDQAALNTPEMLEQLTQSMRLTLKLLGRVETIRPLGFGNGVPGAAAVITPTLGPDHENVRQYIAIADTPTYRISLSCATTAAAIGRASPLFEALAGSIRIEAAR